MNSVRTKNFKIGCFHGKLNPESQRCEATLRNHIFLIGSLKINETQTRSTRIRLIAYEFPLEHDNPRGRCIDLLGYDEEMHPWIVELKKTASNDPIKKVIDQVNGYGEMFLKVMPHVEEEVRRVFLWNDFHFVGEPKKMILSGRDFYMHGNHHGDIPSHHVSGIYCCSFANIDSELNDDGAVTLLDRNRSGVVSLKIENRPRA